MILKTYPLVSICIPTYNSGKTIKSTLESLLAQNYPNFNIYISDNCSTDNTLELINQYNDDRILVNAFEENVGGEGNFNRCIKLAQGKYTAIFHADDVYEPDIITKQVEFLERNKVSAVFTEANLINGDGNRVGGIKVPDGVLQGVKCINFENLFKSVLRHSNYLICPSVMAHTDVYKNTIKSWRGELFNTSADLDVWLRMSKQSGIGFIQEPLINYRISDLQVSAQIRNKTEMSDFFKVTEYYLEANEVKSFLSNDDLLNYRSLLRRDFSMRALCAFQNGDYSTANSLVNKSLNFECGKTILRSKRNILTLLLSVYLKLLILVKAERLGNLTLGYLRRLAGK